MSSILIVDDEPGIRQLLGRWLRPQGYAINEAADADEALASLAICPVDVVLCDVTVPGHDGLWLVAQLRRRFPRVAIVLATASETIAPSVSMQQGVVEYLVKPFDAAHLVAAVARAAEWPRSPKAHLDANDDPTEAWLNGSSGKRAAGGHR